MYADSDAGLVLALEEYALWYLSRYPNVARRHFEQKLRAKLSRLSDQPVDDFAVGRIVDAAVAQGLIADIQAARSRTSRLAGRGWSPHHIKADLARRGIESPAIDQAVGEDSGLELRAAIQLARRRRLGPWRGDAADQVDAATRIAQEMRVFASRGFSRRIAQLVVEASTETALHNLLQDGSPT